MWITAGSTNVSLYVYFVDDVSGTATGEPTTGLLFSDIETGGSASYMRQGAARTDFTLQTLASAAAAHADGGFILVDDTNMPGLYRVDVPDAAFASGVDFVVIQLVAASAKNTLMRPLLVMIQDHAQLVDDVWDEVLSGGTHNIASSAGRRLRGIQEFQGYENGAVWIDTVNGTAGTTSYENGTVESPVDTIADANTIATALGLSRFEIAPGSTITLAATQSGQLFGGHGWTLALGGQNVNNTHFFDAEVSGIATAATEMEFHDCEIGTASLQKSHCYGCTFDGTVTMTLAGDYHYINCQSGVAGSGSPTFTKTAGQAITAEWRRWSGGITISGLQSGDTLTVSGELGTVTLNGADATVELRGTYKALVNNLTGSPTVNVDGAILAADVAAVLVDTGTTIPALLPAALVGGRIDANVGAISTSATAADNLEASTTGIVSTTVNDASATTTSFIITSAEATNDHFNGRIITFIDGALAGQSTDITDYVGATKTVTVTALTEAPANGDALVIT